MSSFEAKIRELESLVQSRVREKMMLGSSLRKMEAEVLKTEKSLEEVEKAIEKLQSDIKLLKFDSERRAVKKMKRICSEWDMRMWTWPSGDIHVLLNLSSPEATMLSELKVLSVTAWIHEGKLKVQSRVVEGIGRKRFPLAQMSRA